MPPFQIARALAGAPEGVGPALLEAPEDQWFDRKSARLAARELGNTLIAMANAEGGLIAIGLHNGVVEGTDRFRSRNEQMQANIDFCVPPVRAKSRLVSCVSARGEEDHLLVFDVQPSDMVHTNVRDEVFLRVGDEERRLGFEQRQELLYDKGQSNYEARVLEGVGPEELDDLLLANYANAISAPSPTRLLSARGLQDGPNLTIAGCLLFAEHPQRYFPEAFIRILRYRGRERGAGARQQLLEDVRIEGAIPRALLAARVKVQSSQPVRRALQPGEGRFGPVPLVPEDAWLEGLVNAVVHRSYSSAGDHIRVEIFDDRIEIASPGRFPGLVAIADPSSVIRFARNPRIARVCADLSFGQELGEGIRRMFEEMRQAGLTDPIYRQTSGSVHLTLLAEPVDRELEARLPEHARAITAALREAGRLSTGEITTLLKVSRPVAQRELGVLREAEVIEWIGKSPRDPRAYWQLNST